MKPYETSPADRFLTMIDKTPRCWLFTGRGRNNQGEAIFELSGRPERKRVLARRFAWELEHGSLPTGRVLIALCEEPIRCVRPDHMADGVKSDRISDAVYAERLWGNVERKANGCWEWQGLRQRYGYTTYRNRRMGTHILAWTVTHGPVPPGMFVCHHCDNPPCCNPDHLFLGSPGANSRDMAAKGRAARTRPAAKLTPDQVREMRAIYKATQLSTHKLGPQFGVTAMAAWAVVTGRSYKHIS